MSLLDELTRGVEQLGGTQTAMRVIAAVEAHTTRPRMSAIASSTTLMLQRAARRGPAEARELVDLIDWADRHREEPARITSGLSRFTAASPA